VVVSSSEVQTISQQGCTSTSHDLPNRECGSNRDGLTGMLPHGPYCCEAEYQGCCTRSYGDLDTRCVNRTSDTWRNQCQSFCTFDIARHTNESSFYTSTCYKTEMMSDTSTSLGFLYSMSTSLFDETLPDPNYADPPPQICEVSCDTCTPRTIGCRWNDAQDLPELYDVLTNLTIPDSEPVVNETGETDTAQYCMQLGLPVGAVGYRDAPSLSSDDGSVACDEANLPYVLYSIFLCRNGSSWSSKTKH